MATAPSSTPRPADPRRVRRGRATGGLEGGPAIGYVGGLVKAVLGLRAAERIAAVRDERSGAARALPTSIPTRSYPMVHALVKYGHALAIVAAMACRRLGIAFACATARSRTRRPDSRSARSSMSCSRATRARVDHRRHDAAK
jgi:hypothetical protein